MLSTSGAGRQSSLLLLHRRLNIDRDRAQELAEGLGQQRSGIAGVLTRDWHARGHLGRRNSPRLSAPGG